MSKDDSLTKVMCHLNNTQFYKKLADDPTEQFVEDIKSSLVRMTKRQMLHRDSLKFLRPKNARISQFYILLKMQKKDVPGRQIVLSCGAPMENISLFVITT